MVMEARLGYIALNGMDRVGPVRAKALLDRFGNVAGLFRASAAELMTVPGIGKELARSITDQFDSIDPEAEVLKAEAFGARIVTLADEDYPERLRTVYDPPLALYVWGSLLPSDRHALAVVGTRHPTHYGISMADRLAYGMAKAGITVVSGLARGIDTAAHQAALKGGGRTLAVLGGALDKLYPAENRKLAEAIAEQGAVLTEYPFGRSPDRTTFPYRNRIVSGLSQGIVVVEAGAQSGAVITANQALEQGRSVYAVPGRVDNLSARGCHTLIRAGAMLCESLDQILEDLSMLLPTSVSREAKALEPMPEPNLSEAERQVVKALWKGALQTDALAREAGIGSAQLSAMLLGLEMKRVIRILPGRVVELRGEVKPAPELESGANR